MTMLLVGIAIGFVAGSAATLATMFIAMHLGDRAASMPPHWAEGDGFEDAAGTSPGR